MVPDILSKDVFISPVLVNDVSLNASDASGEISPLALAGAEMLKSRDGIRFLKVPSRYTPEAIIAWALVCDLAIISLISSILLLGFLQKTVK